MKAKSSKRHPPITLSELLAGHGIRHNWEGVWLAIPRALRTGEPDPRRVPLQQTVWVGEAQADGSTKCFEVKVKVPPDAPPEWVDTLCARIFEIVLPLKRGMSLEFYDAAILGYAFSAMSRELAERPKADGKKVTRVLADAYKSSLEFCQQKAAESPIAAKGFAYGVECQRREPAWLPSTHASKAAKLTTETAKIYEALLRHWRIVASRIEQKQTARQLGEYIAEKVTFSKGMVLADYLRRNPDAKATYLRTFQMICLRVGIPLPRRGRPRKAFIPV